MAGSAGPAHLAAARLIGRPAQTGQTLAGLALAHGYDTAFWWTAGIFAAGAVTAGALLRRGPLRPSSTPPLAHAEVPAAQPRPAPPFPGDVASAAKSAVGLIAVPAGVALHQYVLPVMGHAVQTDLPPAVLNVDRVHTADRVTEIRTDTRSLAPGSGNDGPRFVR